MSVAVSLIPMSRIVAVACAVFGVDRARLRPGKGDCRTTAVRDVKHARELAALLARRHTALSYPLIARALGYASHSSVISAERRSVEMLLADWPVNIATEIDPVPFGRVFDDAERRVLRGEKGGAR